MLQCSGWVVVKTVQVRTMCGGSGTSHNGFWLSALTAVLHTPKKALRRLLLSKTVLAVRSLSSSHARDDVHGQIVSWGRCQSPSFLMSLVCWHDMKQ